MTDVGFYHLTRSAMADALARLLVRTLEAGERALVVVGSAEHLAALDVALWESEAAPWVPHGSQADGDADIQPVWLTTEAGRPVNGARFLFLVSGAETPDVSPYARVFDVFDGSDDAAVAAARERYAAARTAGHALTYWRQTERGWAKQA